MPVLRIEEAMMDEAAARGGRILIVCTQKRAQPVVRGTLEAAAKQAGKTLAITELWVAGARDALNAGDNDTHDRLIAEQIGGRRRVRPDRVRHDVDGAGQGQDAGRARAQGADQRRGRGRAHAQADGSVTMLAARISAKLLVAAAVAALAPPAAAQDFFKGRQISILVAGTAGGGIDIGARILSRHLGKYLPGNPTVVAQLMPGAGGIRMIEHMNSVALRDGTVIGTVAPGPMIEPLIGKRKASFRMTDFAALGAMTRDVSLCVAWGGSKFKTIQDAIAQQMVVAGTGVGASTDIYPAVLNEVLGDQVQGHHRLSGLAGDDRRDRARRGGRPLRLGLVEPDEHQAGLGARQEDQFSSAACAAKASEHRRAAGHGPGEERMPTGRC